MCCRPAGCAESKLFYPLVYCSLSLQTRPGVGHAASYFLYYFHCVILLRLRKTCFFMNTFSFRIRLWCHLVDLSCTTIIQIYLHQGCVWWWINETAGIFKVQWFEWVHAMSAIQITWTLTTPDKISIRMVLWITHKTLCLPSLYPVKFLRPVFWLVGMPKLLCDDARWYLI